MRIASSLYNISSFQVKKKIVDDPRYDAVGSSTLREELFNTFLKAYETSKLQTSKPESGELDPNAQEEIESTETSEADRERFRRERKDRAVKERANKIRAERSKVEADIDKSRQGLNKSENELEFRCAAYITSFPSSYMAPLTVLLFVGNTEQCW